MTSAEARESSQDVKRQGRQVAAKRVVGDAGETKQTAHRRRRRHGRPPGRLYDRLLGGARRRVERLSGRAGRSALEGGEQVVAGGFGLPAPNAGDGFELSAVARANAGDLFQELSWHEEAAVEDEPVGRTVAGGLEAIDERVERGVGRRPPGWSGPNGQRGIGQGAGAFECGEHVGAAALGEGGGEAGCLGQCACVLGHASRECDEGVVGEDAEGRDVALAGDVLAPAVQLAECGELAGPQIARVLDAQVRVGVLVGRGGEVGHDAGELLVGPVEAAAALERSAQDVAQAWQVARVLGGVGEQLRRKWTVRPVGTLVALVESDIEILLGEAGEADGGLAEELGGDLRVEEARDAEVLVAAEQAKIVVGVVQDDLGDAAFEHGCERREVGDGERVDEERLVARRQLHQTDAVEVAVVAGGFGVECEQRHAGDGVGERSELGLRLNVLHDAVRPSVPAERAYAAVCVRLPPRIGCSPVTGPPRYGIPVGRSTGSMRQGMERLAPSDSPDLLVLAGRVHTFGTPTSASTDNAVWIRAGRIAAVGRAERLRDAAGNVPVLERPEATVTPGLADAHIHLTEWALSRRQADLGVAMDPEAAAQLVAQASGDGAWIRGRGWNPHLWNGAQPHRAQLDAVAADRPVALQSHDMHALWANGEALRRAGIDADTPDPPDGRIVRDEAGRPTGLLLENAARLVTDRIPPPTLAELAGAVQAAQAELHALGITAVHSFPGIHVVEPDPLSVLETLRAAGALRLRVLQHIALDRLDAAIALGVRSGFGGDWLRIGGVKMFLDGALGSRTAWMRAPYEGEAQCGMRVLEPTAFRAHVQRAAAAGIASTVHAIGDAAVALALDVLSEPAVRVAALPHRIEHVQCCPPDRLDVAGAAGVVCSMQPAHLITDWRGADRHWGARGRWTYAFRSLLDRGATLAFGSDAPVEPVDPGRALMAATARTDLDGQPDGGWYPEERISAHAALRAYTVGPAHAAGLAGTLGVLVPGALGDLALWNRDPLDVDPAGWLALRCEATVVGGMVVHSDSHKG
jgi:predicted amidohydrolase YtcJ